MTTDIIYNEDCLEGLRKLPDGCIDLCVTDPPYDLKLGGGAGFFAKTGKEKFVEEMKGCGFVDGFNEAVLSEVGRVMKKMNAYFFCSRLQLPMYMDFVRGGGV